MSSTPRETTEKPDNSSPTDRVIKRLLKNSESPEVSESPFIKPETDTNKFQNILDQRHKHRQSLFWFVLMLTAASFLILLFVVMIQTYMRVRHDRSFTIFTGSEFQILSVSIFGQIIGVVYIITKALWDDKPYLEKMLGEIEGRQSA